MSEPVTRASPDAAISTELAMRRSGMSFQRTRMSADRTLMSVIRNFLNLFLDRDLSEIRVRQKGSLAETR